MKCTMCENSKQLRKSLETVKFDESGLDNVTLHNVPVYHCDQCGEEYREYPNLDKLMEAIAESLIRKEKLLTPSEVVFLRKHLGFSRAQFAVITTHSYSTLNKIEMGYPKNPVSEKFDRLVRFCVAIRLRCESYDILNAIAENRLLKLRNLVLSPSKGSWKLEEAA